MPAQRKRAAPARREGHETSAAAAPRAHTPRAAPAVRPPRADGDVRVDERSAALSELECAPVHSLVAAAHPRMMPLLIELRPPLGSAGPGGHALLPPLLPLLSERTLANPQGAFLLEDGRQLLLWIGRATPPAFLVDVFGRSAAEPRPRPRACPPCADPAPSRGARGARRACQELPPSRAALTARPRRLRSAPLFLSARPAPPSPSLDGLDGPSLAIAPPEHSAAAATVHALLHAIRAERPGALAPLRVVRQGSAEEALALRCMVEDRSAQTMAYDEFLVRTNSTAQRAATRPSAQPPRRGADRAPLPRARASAAQVHCHRSSSAKVA